MLWWYPKPVHQDIPHSHFSSMLSNRNSKAVQLPRAPPGRAHRLSLFSKNSINTISTWGLSECATFFPISSWPPLGKSPAESESEVAQSCPTLFATLWTVAYQASPSMGFSRQEYQSGLPFPSPGYLPNPGLEPRSPTLRADALPSEPPGKLVQESHRDRFKGTRKVRMLSSSPSSLGSFSSLGIQKSQAKEWSHIFLCLKWLHSLNFQKWKRLDCFSAVTTFLWFMSIL